MHTLKLVYYTYHCSLVADSVVFNSHFNMDSFLDGIDSHLRLMPDSRPRGLTDLIRHKCSVLYFPLELPHLQTNLQAQGWYRSGGEGELIEEEEEEGGEGREEKESGREEKEGGGGEEEGCGDKEVEGGDGDKGKSEEEEEEGVGDKREREEEREGWDDSEEEEKEDERNGSLVKGIRDIPEDPQPLHIVWPHRWCVLYPFSMSLLSLI